MVGIRAWTGERRRRVRNWREKRNKTGREEEQGKGSERKTQLEIDRGT